MSSKVPAVWVVDGIIGAGKTTFINKVLVPYLQSLGKRVTVVAEPVDKWVASGALQQFYQDPSRRGYQFQTRAFHDRIVEARKCFKEKDSETDIYVLERSIFTDVLFMGVLHDEGTIDETEYRDYMDMWKMWSLLMPFTPTKFIYLCPDVKEAMRRLRNRDRDGEAGVSEDYQMKLAAKHDDFLRKPLTLKESASCDLQSRSAFPKPTVQIVDREGNPCEVPVCLLTTNKDFVEDQRVRGKVCDKVYSPLREGDAVTA